MASARLDMALTAPEYGLGVTPPQNNRPSTVGYYSVYDYTYTLPGGTGGNAIFDTFNRTVANGFGTADTGQSWAIAGGASADYAVTPTTNATITNATTGNRRAWLTAPNIQNVNVLAQVSISQIATVGTLGSAVSGRVDNANGNEYDAFIIWGLAGAATLQINRILAGTDSLISTTVSIGTYTAGQKWWIRLNIVGSTIQARAWADGATEPSAYQVTVVDTTIPGAATANVGVRAFRAGANTNVNAVATWDNFSVGNMYTDSIRALYFAPQRFGEYWSVERVTVNDTSQGQIPTAFIMRGLVRPETAFNLAAITYPHQVPPLLATSQVVDATANGTNDVDDLNTPINLSPGEYFSVLFAGAQYPAPGQTMTSTVFVGGTTTRGN